MNAGDNTAVPDLDTRERVEQFVELFYQRLLQDPQLATIFIEVAAVDLQQHLPHIKDYWSKLLLGDAAYQRHTMNIHRVLHGQQQLTPGDFERWLGFFSDTVTSHYAGPQAEKALRIATTIAANMRKALQV